MPYERKLILILNHIECRVEQLQSLFRTKALQQLSKNKHSLQYTVHITIKSFDC